MRSTPKRAWALGALSVAGVHVGGVAGQIVIPPDTVTTVYVSDTIDGYGAVGGVATDALGYVYVADFRNAVWRLSPEGDLSLFADGLYGASGNAVGPRGFLYQSSFYGNFVSRISRTGEVETYASEGLSGPVGIAVAPDGTLYVVNCTGGYVSRVGTDRTVSEFARHELMACPNGITFDDRGDLYVVNFNNTKVLRIAPDGSVSEHADVIGAGGNGHITFARGAFYVTKLRGNQVFRVERDGAYTVLAGTGQAGEDDGPADSATFTRPNGIATTAGGRVLWVNDLAEGQGAGIGTSTVALRRIRLITVSDVLSALPADAAPNDVRGAFEGYRESRPSEDIAAEAITLGYQWLSSGRIGHGVSLFQAGADAFPANANAQFHAGEAYRYIGQPDQAAAQYRKALALQPDHAQAAARLAEVTGG